MGRLLSGLLLLNLIIACGEKTPQGIISKKVLPDLLVELHLLDGNLALLPIDSARAKILPAYERVLEYYDSDTAAFARTIAYYAERPVDFQQIYEEVTTRLQARIDADNAVRAAAYRRQLEADSLRNIRVRDSLFMIARDSLDLKRKRHLLLSHDADSTVDKQSPVNFVNYSSRLYEDLGLWTLNFEPFIRLDSSLNREGFELKDFIGLDSLVPQTLPQRLLPIQKDSVLVPMHRKNPIK